MHKRTSASFAGLVSVSIVSACAGPHSNTVWPLEVIDLYKASVLGESSKAMVPQAFSRVGSTQADQILYALQITEIQGNEVYPIQVSTSAPAAQLFDFSKYANENAGTGDPLKHHQVELTKLGVKFGRDTFTMYDLHEHKIL